MEKAERSCFTETGKNCFMNYITLSLLLSTTTYKRTMGSGTKVYGLVQAPAVSPE